MRIDGLKTSALYERMIRPSWGWWHLVKRQMPWWSCVCGPSNVLLHELAIYCDSIWYNIHTYIHAELLFSQKQKTAFQPYSFFANVKEPWSNKEIVEFLRNYYPYLATGATLRKERETKVRWKKILRVIAKKNSFFSQHTAGIESTRVR